jgi:hypothetical protein
LSVEEPADNQVLAAQAGWLTARLGTNKE